MFEVDDELYVAFQQVGRERYIKKKTNEFAGRFPVQYAEIGEQGARSFIVLSLEKAAQYNMSTDRELNGLQTLMLYLGCGFDRDPQYPWARFKTFPDKNLTNRHDEPESYIKLCEVYDRFYREFTTTYGEQGVFLRKAYARWQQVDFRLLTGLKSEADVLEFLQRLYPERFDRRPLTAMLRDVVPAARQKAFSNNLDAVSGRAIFAVLIFFYGINVDKDPLCGPYMFCLRDELTPGLRRETFFWNRLKEKTRLISVELAGLGD
jgi:hypothetical protein